MQIGLSSSKIIKIAKEINGDNQFEMQNVLAYLICKFVSVPTGLHSNFCVFPFEFKIDWNFGPNRAPV